MCAGAAAAQAANKNAVRQYEFALEKRERKHRQKLSTYGAATIQYAKASQNIHMGLNASYSRAQTKLNQYREKALNKNQGKFIEMMQKSKYGNLMSSGATGRSINRFGVLERGALGRFYAGKAYELTEARESFIAGTKASRLKAGAAREAEFAKVAFQPTADVAPPKPVMQNVGMALFGDAIGIAGMFVGAA